MRIKLTLVWNVNPCEISTALHSLIVYLKTWEGQSRYLLPRRPWHSHGISVFWPNFCEKNANKKNQINMTSLQKDI